MTLRTLTKTSKDTTTGVIVCFLEDGRIGCYKEQDIVGEIKEDWVVDVKWDKDFYKARVIFIGTYNDANNEEKRLLSEIKKGNLIADWTEGRLLPQKLKEPSQDIPKRKRKIKEKSVKTNTTKKVKSDTTKKLKTTKSDATKKKVQVKKVAKPKKSKDDFLVEVVSVEDESSNDSTELQVSDDSDSDKSPRKKLSISFSDEESLDNMTKVMEKVLPKFRKTPSKTMMPKNVSTPKKPKDITSVSTESSTSKVNEDIKILQRDYAVLKQDHFKLQLRVKAIETTISITSPKKDQETQQMAYNSYNTIIDESNPSMWRQPWQQSKRLLQPPYQSSTYDYTPDTWYGPRYSNDIEYGCMEKEAGPTNRKYFARTKRDDRHVDTERDTGCMYQEKRKDAPKLSDIDTYSLESSRESIGSQTQYSDALTLLQNRAYLDSIKARSSSIKNFAAKLNSEIFTREERSQSNVNGLQGKPKLDPQKITAIRNATFVAYPVESHKQNGVWKTCVKAIDGMNRKLKDNDATYEDSDD